MSQVSGFWDFLTTAANDAGNVLSNVQSKQNYPVPPYYQSPNTQTYTPIYMPPQQNNTMLYIGLGAAALVLILLMKKK